MPCGCRGPTGLGAGNTVAAAKETPNTAELLHRIKEAAAQLVKAIEKWEAIDSQPKSLANMGPYLSALEEVGDLATKLDDLMRPIMRQGPHKS